MKRLQVSASMGRIPLLNTIGDWHIKRYLNLWFWLENPSLLLGAIVVLGLFLATLFPQVLAPRDPEEKGRFLLDVNGQTYAAPFPPNPLYPLGSDYDARDLLSRVVFGARRTLIIALSTALLRMALGGGLGILAGWVGGPAGQWALIASSVSATFPSLLFAWIIIVAIGPGAGFMVFVLGLGLTGWASWTQLLHSEIRRIRQLPYMEAAEAIGVPPRARLLRHVLPNILPLIIPSASQEIAGAMLILAELGFLGVFFGNAVVISMTDLLQQTAQPNTLEWGGMLAGTRLEVFRWYWLPLVPASAFFVSIIGFNLLAEGLRDALDPAQSRREGASRGLRRYLEALFGSGPGRKPASMRSSLAITSRNIITIATVAALLGVTIWFIGQVMAPAASAPPVVQKVALESLTATAVQATEASLTVDLKKAQATLAAGNYAEAAKQFQAIMDQLPSFQNALPIYNEVKKGLDAAKAGQQVLPEYNQAQQMMQNGEWEKAYALLQTITLARPGYADVQSLLVKAGGQAVANHLQQAQQNLSGKQFDKAMAEYNAAFGLLRDNPLTADILTTINRPNRLYDLRIQLGGQVAAVGAWPVAAQIYRQALAEGPLATGADLPMAKFYLKRGDDAVIKADHETAFREYNLALEAARNKQKALVYTIESGDTLETLAKRFSTTVQMLAELNELKDPGQLSIGQELLIPSPAP
ncbi:MAG: ABC transporter permease subunit [Chloroflexi bacterium]|nr:ABC transporter permease subunit [Chloroflexota bacterium]